MHCPICRYDLRGHVLPCVCPECGLSLNNDVFAALFSFERTMRSPTIREVALGFSQILWRPRKYYGMLKTRYLVPICCCSTCILAWLTAIAGVASLTTCVVIITRACNNGIWPSLSHLAWAVYNVYRDSILPSVCLWTFSSLLVAAVARGTCPVARFTSVLSIFGPIAFLTNIALDGSIALDALVEGSSLAKYWPFLDAVVGSTIVVYWMANVIMYCGWTGRPVYR